MLTCKEATRLVSESMDRPLPLGRRVSLQLHLMICGLCRRYRRQIVFLQSLLRDYGEADPEAESKGGTDEASAEESGLPPEARRRIQERIRRETGAAGVPEGQSEDNSTAENTEHLE